MTVYLMANLQFTRQQKLSAYPIIRTLTQPVNRSGASGPAPVSYLLSARSAPTTSARSASLKLQPEGRHSPRSNNSSATPPPTNSQSRKTMAVAGNDQILRAGDMPGGHR